MTHRTTEDFWVHYYRLPVHVQSAANKNFELLKINPFHPSLHFKKIGRWWSIRAGHSYRALGVEKGGIFYWFWIGTHDEYERLLANM